MFPPCSEAYPDQCGLSNDCNFNAILDECEISEYSTAPGGPFFCPFPESCGRCPVDCNNNGIPDECDIASGVSLDNNSDNVPDECEGCQSTALCRHADVNCDNIVNTVDIAIISSSANFGLAVGEMANLRADVNRDGTVNTLDIGIASGSACFGM